MLETGLTDIEQSSEWEDYQAEKDMSELLRVRGVVFSLLEKARGNR